MNVTVKPSSVKGTVDAPASKSMTHRILLLGALADGQSVIRNPLSAEDTDATREVLNLLGVEIENNDDVWRLQGGVLHTSPEPLNCRESGTTLRFMTAICGLINGDSILTGGSSLRARPIQPLLNALKHIGVDSKSSEGFPPVTIQGTGILRGGSTELPGNISSQYVSALLTVAPLAEDPVEINLTTRLESKPYVEMTLHAMRLFGVEPYVSTNLMRFEIPTKRYSATDVRVEGDWSSAAFLLAAGALSVEVSVTGLDLKSAQADKAIIEILLQMGADVKVTDNKVTSKLSKLGGIDIDMVDCPDLFPVVSALCATAREESRLKGLERLRLKESDRVQAMLDGLKQMGVKAEKVGEELKIRSGPVRGAKVNSYMDHRIAMSFAVLALAAKGATTIQGADCVAKSYPGFWHDLEKIGGDII
ncbi:MAG: 3-phosphoshikimate 1-carboxyvinyltransferase [Candidatus Bathyarchaeota archaeon]|nr:3-phosphoshikimate 1-carboxyvinyltransferase [Candidatus Bathyarchaeota archaeon]